MTLLSVDTRRPAEWHGRDIQPCLIICVTSSSSRTVRGRRSGTDVTYSFV